MKAAGLETRVDAAGNTFGTLPGDGAAVLTGSHIDTVPEGGPLDGALGVLAGLECLQTIQRGRARARGGRSRWWRWSDEEGRYGSLFGSRAFTGRLDLAQIPTLRAVDGDRLVDAMARAGYDASRVGGGALRSADPARLRRAAHRAGPAPRGRRACPSALVEGIVGIRRNRLTFIGEPDHAGTTPMALAQGRLPGRLRVRAQGARAHRPQGQRPERDQLRAHRARPGRLQHRARPGGAAAGDAGAGRARSWRGSTASARRWPARWRAGAGACSVVVEAISRTEPARCAPRVMDAVQAACDALQLRTSACRRAPATTPRTSPRSPTPGMLFIPSRGGRSHRPDEMSDWKAIERGTNALLHTLLTPGRLSARRDASAERAHVKVSTWQPCAGSSTLPQESSAIYSMRKLCPR